MRYNEKKTVICDRDYLLCVKGLLLVVVGAPFGEAVSGWRGDSSFEWQLEVLEHSLLLPLSVCWRLLIIESSSSVAFLAVV